MSLKIQTKPKPNRKQNRSQYGWLMASVIVLFLALFLLGGCSQPANDDLVTETETRYIDQAQIGENAPFSMFNFDTKQSHPTANLEGVWNKDVGLDNTTTYTVSFLAAAIGLTGEPITLKARVVNEKPTNTVNDPNYGLHEVSVYKDWTYHTYINDMDIGFMRYVPEKHEVVVGVIDSGIDKEHPAFEGLIDSRSINVEEVDGEGNLFNISNISDSDHADGSHGTHIASLIASKKQPGINIAGINDSKVKLLVIKKGKDVGYISQIAALKQVVALQPDIINCSYVSTYDDEATIEQYEKIRDMGILVVAGAGNTGKQLSRIPGSLSHKNVITVGGLSTDGDIWRNSSFGFNDFMAPADHVAGAIDQRHKYQTRHRSVLTLDYNYNVNSGTSFAAPIITGVLAKMKSYDNTQTNAELKALLIKHAIDMSGDKDGYGRINYKSLAEEFVSFHEYNVVNDEGIQFNILVSKDKATGQVARAVLRYIYIDGAKFSIHEDIN